VYRRLAARAKELIGDLDGAEQDLKTRWADFRNTRQEGPDGRAIEAVGWLAHLYCDQGRWEEAADVLSYASTVPPLTFFRAEAVLCGAARARVAARNGMRAEADALAWQAVELADPTEFLELSACVWLALGDVQRRAGNATGADVAVARAIALYEGKGNVAAARRVLSESPAASG
jgi:tetratricopeptide (TPR) repeat protein